MVGPRTPGGEDAESLGSIDVAALERGQTCGEVAVIYFVLRRAAAECVTRARLLSKEREAFDELWEHDSQLG